IAAQTLGPEFKEWLNDPQKLLQLIAAAEGSRAGGGGGGGGAPIGSVPTVATGAVTGGDAAPAAPWAVGVAPLQPEVVIQAVRLLAKFGEVGADRGAKTELLQTERTQTDPNTKLNLQQLLESLAANNPT